MATIPALLAHLVDSATSDLDGGDTLTSAVAAHRRHGQAWYGDLVNLFVVRASTLPELVRASTLPELARASTLPELARAGGVAGGVAGLSVAVVADTGVERLTGVLAVAQAADLRVRRVEAAVARRGEDPLPGLRRLLDLAAALREREPELTVHAELPLTGGLMDALDILAEAVETPARLGATFRVGGLAGELFPPPQVLAGVICGCRDRGLRFSVSAGLDRALRHNDHETGFTHHGVLNLLAACLAATAGAGQAGVAERLATNDAMQLSELVRGGRDLPRPLWVSYAADRVDEIVHDLTLFEVLSAENPD